MRFDWQRRLAFVLMCAALGACANLGQSVRTAVDSVGAASAGDSAQDRVHAAMDLLQRGEEDRARAMLETALRQEPGNASARRLLDEITLDPQVQLGAHSRAYTVRAGDTMTGLSERFLGDPLLFYALARYNHIAPDQLSAGRTIQIPVRAHAPNTPPRTTATVAAPPAGVPTPAVLPAVNAQAAARANQLRLQGLERLNAGDANGAIALLRQARAIDASNTAIESDLARATRIQAALNTH